MLLTRRRASESSHIDARSRPEPKARPPDPPLCESILTQARLHADRNQQTWQPQPRRSKRRHPQTPAGTRRHPQTPAPPRSFGECWRGIGHQDSRPRVVRQGDALTGFEVCGHESLVTVRQRNTEFSAVVSAEFVIGTCRGTAERAVVSMLVIVNLCLHVPVARDSSKSHGIRMPAWFAFHRGLRRLGQAGSSYIPSTRV